MNNKLFTNALAKALDAQTRVEVQRHVTHAVMSERPEHIHLNGKFTSNLLLLDLYNQIRRYEMRRNKKITRVIIIDYGCGIGNVLATLGLFVQEDKVFLPNLKELKLRGYEYFGGQARAAMSRCEVVSPFTGIVRGDLIREMVLSNAESTVMERHLQVLETNPFSTLEIHFFRTLTLNKELQGMFEEIMLRSANKGAFIVSPDGLCRTPSNGLNVINRQLAKISGNVVFD